MVEDSTTLTLTLTLVISITLGVLGLIAFLWGLKTGQFDDETKFTHGALFDSEEDLNSAIEKENRLKDESKNTI